MYMKRSALSLSCLTLCADKMHIHTCTYSGELKEAEMYMDRAVENANQMLLNARDGTFCLGLIQRLRAVVSLTLQQLPSN